MPIFGQGIVPSGAVGAELAAITRRAFIPKLIVQIYQTHPMLSLLLRNAQRAAGGLSQVTPPVQGSSFVSFNWTGFDGSFPAPVDTTAIQNAEFNLNVGVVPIPFFGMESIIQSSEVVIPRTLALMADAGAVLRQSLATSLYTDNQANPLAWPSLLNAIDNGTGTATYGGINRTVAANAFWKGQVFTGAGGILTRTAFIKKIVQQTVGGGGEAADIVVMSPGDWATLMTDFMSAETFRTVPGTRYGKDDAVNAGFRAIMLADTPIFPDPYCPTGTAYLLNSKYLALYLSEDAPFTFSGFYSLIPNLQIAQIGVLIVALTLVCTKPVSSMRIDGITGAAF